MTVIHFNRGLCMHGELPRASTEIIKRKTRDSSYFYVLPLPDAIVRLFLLQHGVRQDEIATL